MYKIAVVDPLPMMVDTLREHADQTYRRAPAPSKDAIDQLGSSSIGPFWGKYGAQSTLLELS